MSPNPTLREFAPGMFLKVFVDEALAIKMANELADGMASDPNPQLSAEEEFADGDSSLARLSYGAVAPVIVEGRSEWFPFVLIGDPHPEMRVISPTEPVFLWLLRIRVYSVSEDDPERPIGWLDNNVDVGASQLPVYRRRISQLVVGLENSLSSRPKRINYGWRFVSEVDEFDDDDDDC